MTISNVVRDYIVAHPTQLVGRLDYKEQTVWVKRRPESKKRVWHHLLHYLTYLIPLPIIYPTVVTDGAQSLQEEATRFRLFAEHNIPVPVVLDVQAGYLVTSDVGATMQAYLDELTEVKDKYRLLAHAMAALSRLHHAQLCHGRPFLRDMTYLDGQVFFIDLEENPLQVMSLVQAQARDVWLFLNSAARHCNNDPAVLTDLFITYCSDARNEVLASLKQLVFIFRPLRWFVEHGLFTIKSRDIRCAVLANKALEHYFLCSGRIVSNV